MSRIITLGNNLLRQKSLSVDIFDKEMKDFIEKMFEIMSTEKGIGLASVQVGKLKRIFVINIPKDKPRIFINPEIIETSYEQDTFEEGCLSIPGINAEVLRPVCVKIQAWNEFEKPFTLCAEGLLARVIQHEFDHLDGAMFIDHLTSEEKENKIKIYHQKENK